GVADLAALGREFGRGSAQERREALLPFVWGVIADRGQLLGDAGREARVTNGKNFSYPGYNEIFTRRADPRIDSNDKVPTPNVSVLEWLNGREEFRGRVAAFGSWDIYPYILTASAATCRLWRVGNASSARTSRPRSGCSTA